MDPACVPAPQCLVTVSSSTATPASNTTDGWRIAEVASGEGGQVSAGVVGGLVAGFIALVALVCLVALYARRLRHRRSTSSSSPDSQLYVTPASSHLGTSHQGRADSVRQGSSSRRTSSASVHRRPSTSSFARQPVSASTTLTGSYSTSTTVPSYDSPSSPFMPAPSYAPGPVPTSAAASSSRPTPTRPPGAPRVHH